MQLRILPVVAATMLACACGEAGHDSGLAYRGMWAGMRAADLRAAASAAGIGAMECRPLAVPGLAADFLCFTPDSSASSVNVSAMVTSGDSTVPYLAVREALSRPGTGFDRLSSLWGRPDTTIESGRRWQRGRWVASADTSDGILTVWLSDTATSRLVALASARERFRAEGRDTLPYANDADAVIDSLRADSVGHAGPVLASSLSARPAVIHCEPVSPPAELADRTGFVILAYVVDTAGRVEPASVRVLQATHAGFAGPAMASVRSCQLRPGRADGHPVRALVQQRVSFKPSMK